jgi:exopolysaccharide production protein ExoQ
MNKTLLIAERIFVIVFLVFYTSGPLPLILAGGMGQGIYEISPDPTDYSSIQTLFFLNYVLVLFLIIIRWKKVIHVINKEWTIWVLMVLVLASINWSFIPKLTQVRGIALVGTSLFGLYLASRYTIREQLQLLGWAFVTIIIMSFAFAIIIPKYGTMFSGIHTGSWRGIYVHKNLLGRMMVMGTIIFWILAMDVKNRLNSYFWWVAFGLSFCLLILAKSSSSIINFITIFALIPAYNTFRWRYHLMIPGVLTIVTIGASLSLWFNANAATLLDSIGKDATLTGRTDMWPAIIDMIGKQPWLGYGYSAFWDDWDAPGAEVWRIVKWTPPNSHNGLLDIGLELGLLGVGIFTVGFVTTLLRGINWLRVDKSWESFWTILYLTCLVLSNVSESSLLNRNDIFWVLYVSVSFSLAMNNSPPILVQNLNEH